METILYFVAKKKEKRKKNEIRPPSQKQSNVLLGVVTITAQKMKFSNKDFFSKREDFTTDFFITFTEEIHNRKLHFLRSAYYDFRSSLIYHNSKIYLTYIFGNAMQGTLETKT